MKLQINDSLTSKNKQKIAKVSKQLGANSIVRFENTEAPEKYQNFRKMPPVLLPYQQKFLGSILKGKATTYLYEKSRRIGITWAVAALAVLEAGRNRRGGDFIYISTSLALAKEFLLSCAFWAKAFNVISSDIEESIIESEKDAIQSLKITTSSGNRILALPSKPEAIRGRKCKYLCLDEFAFIENQQAFVDAATPLAIWGTKFIYISTHNGVDNLFNQFCEDSREGKNSYLIFRCTLKEAVNQGLYKRICLSTGQEYSVEEQRKWLEKCYAECTDPEQELDVIPSEESVNSIFKKAYFKILEDRQLPEYFDHLVLAFDTAATEKTTSCHTVGTLLGKTENNYYILDFKETQSNALKTHEFLVGMIKTQPKTVPIFVELEGGSQSLLWFENGLKKDLLGYRIFAVKPEGSKLVRAVPVAEKAKEGKLFLKQSNWNQKFLDNINKFDGTPGVPLVTDLGDSLSLAYQQVNKGLKGLIVSGTVKQRTSKRKRYR